MAKRKSTSKPRKRKSTKPRAKPTLRTKIKAYKKRHGAKRDQGANERYQVAKLAYGKELQSRYKKKFKIKYGSADPFFTGDVAVNAAPRGRIKDIRRRARYARLKRTGNKKAMSAMSKKKPTYVSLSGKRLKRTDILPGGKAKRGYAAPPKGRLSKAMSKAKRPSPWTPAKRSDAARKGWITRKKKGGGSRKKRR